MKRILLLSAACVPVLFIACAAEGGGQSEVAEQATVSDPDQRLDDPRPAQPSEAPSAWVSVPTVIDDAVKIEGAELAGDDPEGFAMNAFPPMLSDNEHHAGAWSRTDCLLCHETGVVGAPLVRHRGMSPLLLQSSCRTCHVSADPDAGPLTNLAGEEVPVFASNAFPPTLPGDDSHADPWTRKDCLRCHQWGSDGAPKVRHYGMSKLLLAANCRTCHLPRD